MLVMVAMESKTLSSSCPSKRDVSVFSLAQRGRKSETQHAGTEISKEVKARVFVFNVTQKSGRDACEKKLTQTLKFLDTQ